MSGRRKFGNEHCTRCNGCNGCQEEGSSATSTVQDVTDVTDVRKKEERAIMKEPIPKSQYFGCASVLPSPNYQLPMTNYQLPIKNARNP
jgi:hypothetical protein